MADGKAVIELSHLVDSTRRVVRLSRSKHSYDPTGQWLLDLTMPWDGLCHAGYGVAIPVVLAAVPDQHTSERFDRPDHINTLHWTTSSPTLREPGMWPPAKSR